MTLVGEDEADASAGQISWAAPIARALIGAKVGDERIVRLPAGEKSYEIMAISYPRCLGRTVLGSAVLWLGRELDDRLAHRRRLGRHRLFHLGRQSPSAPQCSRWLCHCRRSPSTAPSACRCGRNMSCTTSSDPVALAKPGDIVLGQQMPSHGSSCRSRQPLAAWRSAETWKNSFTTSVPWSRCCASNSLISSQARAQPCRLACRTPAAR